MKKLSILFILVLVCMTSVVKAGVPDYVICNEDVRFFEKVRYGLTSSIVGIEESGRVRYQANEVVAYRKDGHIYERMPVIKNHKETGRHCFMELVAYRNGLKVYKNVLGDGPLQEELIVYKDGKYVVKFDGRNSETLTQFFFSSAMVASKE